MKKKTIFAILCMTMAVSMFGCGKDNNSNNNDASATQEEATQMLNNNKQSEIEVAEPDYDEQGTESALTWVELAQLDTNETLREGWTNAAGLELNGEKVNALFLNSEGKMDDNNTLRGALHNDSLTSFLTQEAFVSMFTVPAAENYADVDADDTQQAIMAGINGYFNILPDAEPNYANMGESLTRAEFMSAVFRADTPVQELEADADFTEAVGKSDYNIYAQGVESDSYLQTENGSLDETTYNNGAITKAEAIYTLVSRYYADDLKNVDLSTTDITFTDAKENTSIKVDTSKKYAESEALNSAIQEADKGLPTDLYKALVVAAQHEIIDATEDTEWDTALTKQDAIQLLYNTYTNEAEMNYNVISGVDTSKTEESSESKPQLNPDAGYTYIETDEYGNTIMEDENGNRVSVTNEDRIDFLENRTDEEIQADLEDHYLGYEVKKDANGVSYLLDLYSGKEIHIGESMNGQGVYGGLNTKEDRLYSFRESNPDSDWTDEQILSMVEMYNGGNWEE